MPSNPNDQHDWQPRRYRPKIGGPEPHYNPIRDYDGIGPKGVCGESLAERAAAQAGTKALGVNPKDAIGASKPPTWSVVPRWVSLMVGRVMAIGASKYGKFNYRDAPVRASIYIDAAERHMALWTDGEDNDDETGVSHLASVIACCTILMDAEANNSWHDDRPKTGLVRKALDHLAITMKEKPLPAYQG